MIEIFALSTPLKAVGHVPIGLSVIILVFGFWMLFKLFRRKEPVVAKRKRKNIISCILLVMALMSGYNLLKEISFNNNLKDIVAIDNEYLRVSTSYPLYKRIPKEDVKEIKISLRDELCHFEIKYDDYGNMETIKFNTKRKDVPNIKECAIDKSNSLVEKIPI